MATITPTDVAAPINVMVKRWSMGDGDTGVAVDVSDFPEVTIQVSGFSSSTLVIEGTLESSESVPVYATLNDPQGNALSMTASAIETVQESATLIRPRTTADGGDTLIVTLKAVKRGG